jgi:hypothetical protein
VGGKVIIEMINSHEIGGQVRSLAVEPTQLYAGKNIKRSIERIGWTRKNFPQAGFQG